MNKMKVSTGVSCNCDEKNKNQKKRDSIRHEIRKKRLELAIIKIKCFGHTYMVSKE